MLDGTPILTNPNPNWTFWQVCWTEPSLVQYVLNWCEKQMNQNPTIGYLQISPNDGGDTCATPSELQANAEEGTKSGSLFRAINAIAGVLASRWPDVKIVTLAYAWTQHPPRPLSTSTIPRMHPNVIIYFAPIDDNFAIPHLVPASSPVRQFCGSDSNCLLASKVQPLS